MQRLKDIWASASRFDKAIILTSPPAFVVEIYFGWYLGALFTVLACAWSIICADGVRAWEQEHD